MNIMTYLSSIARRVIAADAGAVAVEYAFLAAFIAVVAAVGMVFVGPELQDFFTDTGGQILGAGSGNFTNDPFPPPS